MKRKIIKVFTVIPYNEEFSTQHFETKNQADDWAKTYRDGAQVVENEIPENIIENKKLRTAKYGYRL